MYADDTTAYVIQDSVDNVCIALQKTLEEIQQWCRKHKLTIHPEKTKVMILNRQKFTGPLPQLTVEEQNIEYASECECLGILIDNKLNWKPQAKKVSKTFGAKVKKIRTMNYLPKKFLEEIYFKTIIPAVLYTILVWGNCSPSMWNEIEKYMYVLQRRHIRSTNIYQQKGYWKLQNGILYFICTRRDSFCICTKSIIIRQ